MLFRAVDGTSVASPPATREFNVDTAAPAFVAVQTTDDPAIYEAVFDDDLLCSTVDDADFSVGDDLVIATVACESTAAATVGIGLAAAPDGGDTLTFRLEGEVTDQAGNVAPASVAHSVESVNEAPSLSIVSGPADGELTAAADAEWTGTASDADGAVESVEVARGADPFVAATCDGCGLGASVEWSYSGADLASGDHTLTFRVTDGNGAVEIVELTITVDADAPVFESIRAVAAFAEVIATFSEPLDCTTVATTDFSATVSRDPVPDVDDGVDVIDVTCDSTSDVVVELATAPQAGSTVKVSLEGEVTDLVGNDADPGDVTTTTEAHAPEVQFTTGPGDGTYTNGSQPEWTGTATDTTTGLTDDDAIVVKVEAAVYVSGPAEDPVFDVVCDLDLDAEAVCGEWTFQPAGPLVDGEWTVEVVATDDRDQEGSATRSFTVDTVAPSLDPVLAAAALSNEVTATFVDGPLDCSTVDDADFTVTFDGIAIPVVGATCQGEGVDLTLAGAPLGGQEVVVSAQDVSDLAGNQAEPSSASVVLPPPAV